ncbi:MAG: hypothetical protein KKE61_03655 [Proteobacteria bacterium]|nr:hypothetical protein [Pseudomonadota bacterium]
MAKLNCWEFIHCERQPGGANVLELGLCPASTTTKADGINGGKNGGRACWALSGTLCGAIVQGAFATKIRNCMKCDFYKLVQNEQKSDFWVAAKILKKIGE